MATLLRPLAGLGLLLALSGCVSERHFIRDSWPFGNPNEPAIQSETAQRAVGRPAPVTPIPPQAGDVWPGPVQPVPTLNDIQQNSTLPLGQGYTPSLPSPYPPGQNPAVAAPAAASPVTNGSLYSPNGGPDTVPAVPGHIRNGD